MNPTCEPLVSIVTPVYNEEEHLEECIQSILAQSYSNWDYVIVNNCSTDRTMEIAQAYAAKDSRIRVHSNEQFLPMLANHNVAVGQISGDSKYCKVVLGDDLIFDDCLKKMVAVAEQHPSVGIVSSYQLHGTVVRSAGLPYTQTLVSGREACRSFLRQDVILFGTQTSVLYRSDLVRARNPFYVESNMCADFEVCFALLRDFDLGFVHQVLTYSRPRPGSIGSVTSDTGATLGSLLEILQTYGGQCLNEGEFEECLALQVSEYYEFLGRRLWVERDRSFWEFHRRVLDQAGVGFSRLRVARAALGAFIALAATPRALRERIGRLSARRRWRSRQSRGVIAGFDSGRPAARPPAVQGGELRGGNSE